MKKITYISISLVLICALLAGCKPAASVAASTVDSSSDSVAQSSSVAASAVQDPTAAYSTTIEDIKAKGELVIGLDDTFAPMGFRDEAGNLVGFDIDLAEALCAELGVKAKFQPINWDAKELELTSGNIDCIWNGMSITPERQQAMNMSQPYLNNIIAVMSVQGVVVRSAANLEGLRIGIQAGSAALEAVKASSIYPNIEANITEYPTYDEVILDMQAGRLDCMIIDEVYGSYKNKKLDYIFETSPFDFGDDLYGIGFRKSDSALRDTVNETLNALIANGTAAKISNTWFGTDIVVKP